jgi:hypothetical protein
VRYYHAHWESTQLHYHALPTALKVLLVFTAWKSFIVFVMYPLRCGIFTRSSFFALSGGARNPLPHIADQREATNLKHPTYVVYYDAVLLIDSTNRSRKTMPGILISVIN